MHHMERNRPPQFNIIAKPEFLEQLLDLQKAAKEFGPYKTVCFGDLALHSAVERFGGWPEVCSWDLERWRFAEKSFVAAYEAAISAGDRGPLKLMGHYEYENTGKMFDGKALEIALPAFLASEEMRPTLYLTLFMMTVGLMLAISVW